MVIGTQSGEVIVWKVSDGSQRGAMTLALASLSHLGVKVDGIEREVVLGGGEVVGEIRASKLVCHG
jgi:ferric-dicitrate binding protein FerR (iron transport regulator)